MAGEEHTNGVFKCSCDTGNVRQSDFNAAGSLTSVWCVGAFKLNAAHLFSNIIPSYIYTLSPMVLEHMGLNFLQTGVHSGDNIIITFKMATTSSFLILGEEVLSQINRNSYHKSYQLQASCITAQRVGLNMQETGAVLLISFPPRMLGPTTSSLTCLNTNSCCCWLKCLI